MALVVPASRGYTTVVTDPLSSTTRDDVSDARSAGAATATREVAPRVAVHADDESSALAWCQALRAEGLAVALGDDGSTPVQALVLHCTQRLPERLGTLRELRAAEPERALIVVCHALRELDQVLALEMGADDVLDARTTAPVVAARLRALWRRGSAQPSRSGDRLDFGRLTLHLRERSVRLGAERIDLTECEFEVLWLLALQAGRAVSLTELLERLRGLPYQRIDRSIDCRVYRIRAKLGDAPGPAQHIRTVRNCGYLFSPARW
jgi:DNA-binding response OmpR family regulator